MVAVLTERLLLLVLMVKAVMKTNFVKMVPLDAALMKEHGLKVPRSKDALNVPQRFVTTHILTPFGLSWTLFSLIFHPF